ncbi:uncharacterized protein G2W53_039285 [Senna tora]|uniref:Uncharacterized protein n=1 Tax=Senna tora TaxID=362788 RepID=A0A834W7U8_9FABA|nr:uncharacterized protein G2W53_039285 [Senna tora]
MPEIPNLGQVLALRDKAWLLVALASPVETAGRLSTVGYLASAMSEGTPMSK